MSECTEFQRLIPDAMDQDAGCVAKIVFCTGRTYYDLLEARKIRGKDKSVVLCRVEQVCFSQQTLDISNITLILDMFFHIILNVCFFNYRSALFHTISS